MTRIARLFATTATLALWATAASAQDVPLPALGPDDLMFSIDNMDLNANPAEDFERFAAGGWLDRVKRPPELASYSFVNIQKNRIKAQTFALLEQVVKDAPAAPEGSATQLVGNFYTAYMDKDRRDAQGMAPLKDELDRIAAMSSLDDLLRYAARFQTVSGQLLFFAIGPFPDLVDSKKYSVLAGPGSFGLETERDVYVSSEDAPRRKAYRAYVENLLKTAGYEADAASRMTDTVLAIETELNAAKLTDEEKRNPRNIYNLMSIDELRAQIPNVELLHYFEEIGLEAPEKIVVIEPGYYPVLSKMLDERPLEDFKDYAAFLLIHTYSDVLSTNFDEPRRALHKAFQGVDELDPIEDRALALLTRNLGHPISRIYAEATFKDETREQLLAMIDEILTTFRERIPTRDWLSEATKAEALAKLDSFYVAVGYPDEKDWVDYSGLKLGPDDPVSNLMAISAFNWKRDLDKMDGPVTRDKFYGKSTYPIAMNSGYNFGINGFEITAAIAQPPAYQPDAIAAVRYCGFGGILGHEATHGFDTSGRQYDAEGNLRNWWTEEDTEAFLAEAQKLVDQADQTEIVAGHGGRGEYWLPENMADVGGITLAHATLMRHLKEHPNEDIEVGGFSQEQLCFITWAQLWAEQSTDEYLINVATAENHPPNSYRTTAPLQHVDAFYEAFDIKEGDPMWLPPEKRVRAW
jgi:putative endopeptidase